MTNKGGALLARHHEIPRKRYETGSPSRLYLEHALGLSDFMLHVERSCRRRKDVKLIYEHEILEHGSDELRKRHGWPVTIEWEGNDLEIWIVPDRLFGIQFLDKPKGKDTRYFAVEYDRGNMPVKRSNIYQSSYLKKLLAYDATYQEELYREHLGVDYFHVLNITTSEQRIDSLIDAFQEYDLAPASAFRFTSRLPKPSIGGFEDVFEIPWRNAAGKTVKLPS